MGPSGCQRSLGSQGMDSTTSSCPHLHLPHGSRRDASKELHWDLNPCVGLQKLHGVTRRCFSDERRRGGGSHPPILATLAGPDGGEFHAPRHSGVSQRRPVRAVIPTSTNQSHRCIPMSQRSPGGDRRCHGTGSALSGQPLDVATTVSPQNGTKSQRGGPGATPMRTPHRTRWFWG